MIIRGLGLEIVTKKGHAKLGMVMLLIWLCIFFRCARLFGSQDGKSIWLSQMRRWGATELASFPPRASQMLMSLRAIAFIFIMPHYDFYEYMALRTYICKNNTKKKGKC